MLGAGTVPSDVDISEKSTIFFCQRQLKSGRAISLQKGSIQKLEILPLILSKTQGLT